MQLLTDDEIKLLLSDMSGWVEQEHKLRLTLINKNYQNGLENVYKVGQLAEKLDHHPEIQLSYNELIIEFWTHSAGGVTQKDIDAARAVNGLLQC